jgi:hypothetical protein
MKGKYHGTVDIGLSFVTYKAKHRRIDIDAEDLIYHIKVGRVRRQPLIIRDSSPDGQAEKSAQVSPL